MTTRCDNIDACNPDRHTSDRSQGVWTTCDCDDGWEDDGE